MFPSHFSSLTGSIKLPVTGGWCFIIHSPSKLLLGGSAEHHRRSEVLGDRPTGPLLLPSRWRTNVSTIVTTWTGNRGCRGSAGSEPLRCSLTRNGCGGRALGVCRAALLLSSPVPPPMALRRSAPTEKMLFPASARTPASLPPSHWVFLLGRAYRPHPTGVSSLLGPSVPSLFGFLPITRWASECALTPPTSHKTPLLTSSSLQRPSSAAVPNPANLEATPALPVLSLSPELTPNYPCSHHCPETTPVRHPRDLSTAKSRGRVSLLSLGYPPPAISRQTLSILHF